MIDLAHARLVHRAAEQGLCVATQKGSVRKIKAQLVIALSFASYLQVPRARPTPASAAAFSTTLSAFSISGTSNSCVYPEREPSGVSRISALSARQSGWPPESFSDSRLCVCHRNLRQRNGQFHIQFLPFRKQGPLYTKGFPCFIFPVRFNYPKAAEIEADNAARQEWNRTADMALVSGIEEAKILEVKKEEIHQKASQSIKAHGWLPTCSAVS